LHPLGSFGPCRPRVEKELIGHLGSDPETKTSSRPFFPQSGLRQHPRSTTITIPERQFRTACLTSTNFADGTEITQTLVDFEDYLNFYRKGAWIGVCGYFQTRQDIGSGRRATDDPRIHRHRYQGDLL
jgi:hypothetical protein